MAGPLDFLGSLIGAGASIFGQEEQSKTQKAIADENIKNQMLFAQNAIQWKVNDAKAAGINPLAALGASTSSFSNIVGNTDAGSGIKQAGQDVGRAVAALSPTAQRSAELENKLLEAKIANVNADTVTSLKASSDMATKLGQPATPPAIPMPRPNPLTVNWDAHLSPPMTSTMVTQSGDLVNVPTAEAAQRTQTLGALPANVVMAVEGLRNNLDHFKNFMTSGSRGDVWRAADPNQYTPF